MIDTLNVLGVCWFRQNQGSPHTYSEAFLPGREWQSVGWRLCVQGRSRELLGRSQRPSPNTKREGFWARVPPCSWKAQWEHRPRVSHCTLTRGSKSGSQRPPSSLGLQLHLRSSWGCGVSPSSLLYGHSLICAPLYGYSFPSLVGVYY